MADPISATVAFAVAAWNSAVTFTAVALTNVGVMAAIGEGATIALAGKVVSAVALAGLSAASMAMMRPQTPSSGTALDFKPDTKAPIRGLMGYHATGGSKVFQGTWGYNGVALSMGAALSLGPIDAITQFQADGSIVNFSGSQGEATGFYAKDMWQRTTTGRPDDAAILPPTGFKYGTPGLVGWGTENSAKGAAFAFWTMLLAKNPEDRDVYTNGVPDPRWIGRWMRVYDWRRDSTYPGGSGDQREDDWTTWQWSENPYVHARAWLRGHFKLNDDGSIDRTKRIAGVGISGSAIDTPAFTEAANVAEANGWTISGEWSTSDDKWQVLAAMMQAGSGQPINRGAQVSVMVNTPRVSTYTYTRDDMIGQASVRPLTRRRDRKNTIIPRYRSEQHDWEYVAAEDVTSSVYRAEDRGEPRSTEVQYTYVRNAKQAGQLAAYDLVNLREGLTVTLPSKVHLMHVHAGDCITIAVDDMAMPNQKVIVMRTSTDYKGAVTTLECRSETDGKHAFALGQAANPPPSPGLEAVDPHVVGAPLAADWSVVAKPGVAGVQQPSLLVTGSVETTDIDKVIVEYGNGTAGPWTSAGQSDTSVLVYQINSLEPGAIYYVSIRYVANNGAISPRLIKGPVIAPKLIANDVTDEAKDEIVQDVLAQIGDIITERNEAEKVAESLLEAIIDAHHATWREQKQKNEGVAIAYQSSQIYTDEFEARATMTFATIAALDDGLAATLNQSEAYTNGTIASAMNLVYTKAETDAGFANTLQQSKSYTDDASTQASLLFATKTERADGDATTLISAKSYTDDYKTTAALTFATISNLNGVNATAGLALSTSVDAQGKANATVGLVTDVNGYVGGFTSINNGTTSTFYILADKFGIRSPGGGARTEYTNGIWYSYSADGATRSSWGKPHGTTGDLTWWTGPNATAIGSESRASAYVYVAMASPRFGGSDTPTGGSAISATASPDVVYGYRVGAGYVESETVTITVGGPGASGATVQWVKTNETGGGNITAIPSGKTAKFGGTVAAGGSSRALYLAVVSAAGLTATVLVDVQLVDTT